MSLNHWMIKNGSIEDILEKPILLPVLALPYNGRQWTLDIDVWNMQTGCFLLRKKPAKNE